MPPAARDAVVHTTVDVSLQEAWAKTPNGKKRETTHIVRCETEILRVKNSNSRDFCFLDFLSSTSTISILCKRSPSY